MRIFVVGIMLLLVHVMDAALVDVIRIGDIAPNFMIMIIVSFALLRGSKEATIIGCVSGILHDISFGIALGPMILIYSLIGYICGKFNANFYRENFILPFLCTMFSSFALSFYHMLNFIMRGKLNFLFFVRSIIIPELIYTITLSLIVYQLMYLINEKLEVYERKTRNIFD